MIVKKMMQGQVYYTRTIKALTMLMLIQVDLVKQACSNKDSRRSNCQAKKLNKCPGLERILFNLRVAASLLYRLKVAKRATKWSKHRPQHKNRMTRNRVKLSRSKIRNCCARSTAWDSPKVARWAKRPKLVRICSVRWRLMKCRGPTASLSANPRLSSWKKRTS